MKKKLAAILLLAALAASLAGCSSRSKDPKPYAPGAWNGDAYESAFMNLRFSLPEGWTAVESGDLEEMSAQADKTLDQVQGGDGSDPASVYHYELSARDPDTGDGVQLLVQKYAMSTRDYASGLEEGAKAEGAAYTTTGSMDITFAGRRFICIPLTVDGAEAPYQRQYIRKEGDYLINVMLFSTQSDKSAFETLEGCFSPMEE